MTILRFLLPILLAFTVAPLAVPVAASQEPLHLPIGDPDRKDREVAVVLDGVVDTTTGEVLTPAELPSRLAEVRLLFVGESHTDMDIHRVQLRVIETLHRAGRRVMIGLEMFPYMAQPHLDAWSAGHLTEQGFLDTADWYGSWSYNWLYYRDIFLFARDHGLDMVALNTPRKTIRKVREEGLDALSDDEAAHVAPSVELGNAEHRRLFRSYFDDDDPIHASMSEEQWDGMVRAQATWDATMGYNAVRALDVDGDGDGDGNRDGNGDGSTILIVLIGSGHVAYGLGIERQAAQWLDAADASMASLVPVPVEDGDGEPIATVRASYTDFIWGLPAPAPPLYPELGVSTREIDDDEGRRRVIFVSENSPAAAAGVEVGDVLRKIDGVAIDGKGVVGRLLAEKRWGDAVRLTVLRGEEERTLEVVLRRSRAEKDEAGDE